MAPAIDPGGGGGADVIDPSRFDHEVAQALLRFPPPDVSLADPALARSTWAAYFRLVASASESAAAKIATEDLAVGSLVDDHAIPLRVYRPAAASGRGLVYLHSGAFVIGDLELEDARCRVLAREAQCIVVSVDYRLAPEHPFPLPLDDCHSALRWVVDHADELEVDRRRLGVGGCSAGGALAAGLAARCRDAGGPELALQMLLYPVLDASHTSDSFIVLSSAEDVGHAELMWRHYLDGPRSEASPYASPAGRQDLGGLPPAYVAAGEFDALRDEAIAYAQRLLHAGVSVELHVWPRVPHAVDLFAPDARVSRDSVMEQADALRRLLG